jgi:hypothetical protein
MNGGERIAAVLRAHGVPVLFTLCGGHISPILAAAKARHIRVVDTRDEATAVFAADAMARLTGTPGVAAVTAGPGLTNAVTALKNAQLAGSPLLLLGGAAPTALQGRGALQDIDQRPLVAPHVKRVFRVRRVRDLDVAVEQALRLACDGVPGPVFVECAVDLLYDEALVRQWYAEAAGKGTSIADRLLRWYLNQHAARMQAGSGYMSAPEVAAPAAPHAAVRAIAARPTCWRRAAAVAGDRQPGAAGGRAGAGDCRGDLAARHPGVSVRHGARPARPRPSAADAPRAAQRAARGRLRAARRRAVRLPPRLRQARAPLGAAHRRQPQPRRGAPEPAADGGGDRRCRADADPAGGTRRHARSGRRGWRNCAQRDDEREREIDAQAGTAGEHVNALALFRALDAAAGDDAVMVADGGDFVATASYIVRPRGPLSWLDPGAFGTLGVGAGFALGAKLARPDSEVWLIWGDGASGYGLAEFDTFVRHGCR